MNKCENCGTPTTLHVAVATAKGVADRWQKQYFSAKDGWSDSVNGKAKDIHGRLCALGPNPEIAVVADIIGNKSWCYLSCSACSEYVERAAVIGYEQNTYVCTDCAKSIVTVLSKPAT